MTTPHTHVWEYMPTKSSRTHLRYRCACDAWAYREFTARAHSTLRRLIGGVQLGPMTEYVEGAALRRLRTEPDENSPRQRERGPFTGARTFTRRQNYSRRTRGT